MPSFTDCELCKKEIDAICDALEDIKHNGQLVHYEIHRGNIEVRSLGPIKIELDIDLWIDNTKEVKHD